jgi:predicted ATPase
VRLDKLEALVAANAPAAGDVQSLAELLGTPLDGRYPALDLTPQRRKEKTFEALLRQIAGLAQRRPVLMIFEDLHWADPSSRELLDLTVEQIERTPVLLIATFRPEFQAPWADRPHVTTLSLRRLDRDESDRLIRGLIGDTTNLSGGVVEEIVERTDGVPLFLEELTKAVLENAAVGTIPATSLSVPATLHASLTARLDRLGPIAKEIAQTGAAIGRDFSYELLTATAQRSTADLEEALARLVGARLVFRRGMPPEATFLFKHALVHVGKGGCLLVPSRAAIRGESGSRRGDRAAEKRTASDRRSAEHA